MPVAVIPRQAVRLVSQAKRVLLGRVESPLPSQRAFHGGNPHHLKQGAVSGAHDNLGVAFERFGPV